MAGKTKSQKRAEMFKEQRGLCWICGGPMAPHYGGQPKPYSATLDHIIPRALGGSSRRENLRLAHRRCNEVRGCPAATNGAVTANDFLHSEAA